MQVCTGFNKAKVGWARHFLGLDIVKRILTPLWACISLSIRVELSLGDHRWESCVLPAWTCCAPLPAPGTGKQVSPSVTSSLWWSPVEVGISSFWNYKNCKHTKVFKKPYFLFFSLTCLVKQISGISLVANWTGMQTACVVPTMFTVK